MLSSAILAFNACSMSVARSRSVPLRVSAAVASTTNPWSKPIISAQLPAFVLITNAGLPPVISVDQPWWWSYHPASRSPIWLIKAFVISGLRLFTATSSTKTFFTSSGISTLSTVNGWTKITSVSPSNNPNSRIANTAEIIPSKSPWTTMRFFFTIFITSFWT